MKKIGIVSYGAYIPAEMILASEIEVGQGAVESGIPQALLIEQKTVPAKDEDTATISVAAGLQALERLELARESGSTKNQTLTKDKIGTLFIGSESHPYAVKPTGTVVASALHLPSTLAMADLQFACKAGTQSLQIAYAYAKAELVTLGMAIGADTAQGRPGDVLEFTAGAGGVALVVGSDAILVEIEATFSVASDTPDFWRRPGQPYPEHAGRFSGEPAYFAHISQAAMGIMQQQSVTPADFDYCVFHTPNGKFPRAIAKKLGFTQQQLEPSLVVNKIGNTYAAASLLALTALLDQAEANKKILLVSYGSGSGSDAFILRTTEELPKQRKKWNNLLKEQIKQLQPVSYTHYMKRANH
jgi:hydroxymethylglutaryl-CoA synthase